MQIHPSDLVEIRADGQKYALREIAVGEKVIKYGLPIGIAIAAIQKGERVGPHNLKTALSGLGDAPIRYIVEDCRKFVEREIRRGNRYDAVIMDPPSYGRGPTGELWKLEENIHEFIALCVNVLSDDPLFFLVNSYTTGLSPSTMGYLLNLTLTPKFGGKTVCDEVGLPVTVTGAPLPCGAAARWEG